MKLGNRLGEFSTQKESSLLTGLEDTGRPVVELKIGRVPVPTCRL